jgi:Flp pilus assembly protein TadD
VALDAANCATGEFIAREQREADSKERVLTELGQAASSFRARLGESLASIQKFDAPIEKATTNSLGALRSYTEGVKLLGTGLNRQAITFLQRAIELDSNFAQAYRALGVVYNNLRQPQLARENFAKAFELRDRVSEPERFSITARYYDTVTGNADKAIETYELWKKIYPRDYTARTNLAIRYNNAGRFEDSLAEFQEAARLSPNTPIIRGNLAAGYMQLGRFDEAKAVIKKALEQRLNHPQCISLFTTLLSLKLIPRRCSESGIGQKELPMNTVRSGKKRKVPPSLENYESPAHS